MLRGHISYITRSIEMASVGLTLFQRFKLGCPLHSAVMTYAVVVNICSCCQEVQRTACCVVA
jgi:hypothetical protein